MTPRAYLRLSWLVLGLVGLVPTGATAAPSADAALAERTYRSIADTATKHGWACVYVGEPKQEGSFAYTVGLSGKGVPELILITGDDQAAACTMLNLVAKALLARSAPIDDGDAPIAKLAKSVRVRRIYSGEFFDRCVLAAMWRDRHDVRNATGMQVVLADKNGRFPD